MPKNISRTDSKSIEVQARRKALDLLARREHAVRELRDKLIARGVDRQVAGDTVENLVVEGLVSDRRFVEDFLRARKNRGYGPLRIQAELRRRGIDDELVLDFINPHEEQWAENIRNVWLKHFGGQLPTDLKDRARQTRFLQFRGFTSAQISQLFKHVDR